MWPSIFIGVDMYYPQKHRDIVYNAIQAGRPTAILDGELVDVQTVAQQMGQTVNKVKIVEDKAIKQTADKYRKEHADMGKQDHSGDIEDAGDGISES